MRHCDHDISLLVPLLHILEGFHGFPIPNMSFAIGRMDLVTKVKFRTLQSPVDTVAACILIRTSLSFGAGLSTSLNRRRSGGPYRACRIAFISVPIMVVIYTACLHVVRVSC